MAIELIDLSDRIVIDTGEVVAKYDLLLKRAMNGEDLSQLRAVTHPDVLMYNKRKGNVITIWTPTEEPEGPAPETYTWNIPEKYRGMDVNSAAAQGLKDSNKISLEYTERLAKELEIMATRDMFDFVRCLIWIRDVFIQHGVVWGIRGSGAASLVLYALGISRVDPIRYDIKMEEFLK